jgi:hydrogenase/urease accessory protein HupE
MSLRGLILFALALLATGAWAHESRPAYLEITESAPGRYDVLWRTPVLSGMRLPVALLFPAGTRDLVAPAQREYSDSLVERRVLEIQGGIAGKRIELAGLQATITDVLARVQLLDGAYSTTLVHPKQAWLEVEPARGALAVAGAYLLHGIEHILFGYDHLLFVLALMLVVHSTRRLVWTVTAFTAAHSITLALATLGVVSVPGPPVEATIALSILLLATEMVRLQSGRASLAARKPWLVAFAFGLLHGFGLAGALANIGLPKGDIPLALLAFNVGVELGQLAFVAAVLGGMALVRRIDFAGVAQRYLRPAAPYAIGSLAAFWFFERLAAF